MTCYIIPLVAAIVHYGLRKKVGAWKNNSHHLWLSFFLAGGAIFGVTDHLWNGELFLMGENILWDLMLGVTITAIILTVWAISIVLEKANIHKTGSPIE